MNTSQMYYFDGKVYINDILICAYVANNIIAIPEQLLSTASLIK
jgi:hypothetical protein